MNYKWLLITLILIFFLKINFCYAKIGELDEKSLCFFTKKINNEVSTIVTNELYKKSTGKEKYERLKKVMEKYINLELHIKYFCKHDNALELNDRLMFKKNFYNLFLNRIITSIIKYGSPKYNITKLIIKGDRASVIFDVSYNGTTIHLAYVCGIINEKIYIYDVWSEGVSLFRQLMAQARGMKCDDFIKASGEKLKFIGNMND